MVILIGVETGLTLVQAIHHLKLYNIGDNQSVELMHFINVLEKALGKEAKKEFLPMQAGDVPETYTDIDDLMKDVIFEPKTSTEEGIAKFVEWYEKYYEVK